MSAIAGAVGATRDFSTLLGRMIAAQRRYGSKSAIEAQLGAAHFGALPSDTQPAIQQLTSPPLLVAGSIRLDHPGEVARALGIPGKPSDLELATGAYLRWGDEGLQKLHGDFAVAILDGRDGSLILMRDPVGQQPLFYAKFDGAVVFASMPNGVAAAVGARADTRHLALQLNGLLGRRDSTPFAGVHRVLPGECIRFVEGRAQRHLYWSPSLAPLEGSFGELTEQFRGLFDEAVRTRLDGSGQVLATHLSAGFDSSSVAATAAKARGGGQRLIAFTSAPARHAALIVPKQRIGDESEIAAATAASLGIEHQVIRVTQPMFAGHADFVRCHGGIATPQFNLGWWTAIRAGAASAGARVLLTGELGNYGLSAGGLPVLADWLRQRAMIRWWSEARAAVARSDVRWLGIARASAPWLPTGLIEWAERMILRVPEPARFGFTRAELVGDVPPEPEASSFAAERLRTIQMDDPGTMRLGSLAQSGVHEHDPTADRRFLEFVLRLPPEHLLHHGEYRPLARAAMSDRLPEAVLNPKVRGFQGADWLARFSQAEALDLLDEVSASAGASELVDLARLRAAILEWVDPERMADAELIAFGVGVTTALSAGLFVRQVERYPEDFGAPLARA